MKTNYLESGEDFEYFFERKWLKPYISCRDSETLFWYLVLTAKIFIKYLLVRLEKHICAYMQKCRYENDIVQTQCGNRSCDI